MFFTGDRASMWNWVAGMTCAAFSLITFFLILGVTIQGADNGRALRSIQATLDQHVSSAASAMQTIDDLQVTQRVQWALQERFHRDVMARLGALVNADPD